MRALRILGGVLALVFCLAPLRAFLESLFSYLKLRSGQPFYIDFSYGSEAVLWLVWALAALVPVVYSLLRKQSSAAWLGVGFLIALLAAVSLPSRYGIHRYRARSNLFQQVLAVGTAISSWGGEHGHYPAGDADLKSALQEFRPEQTSSPFARGGQRLPYKLVYVKAAGGPVLQPAPGAEPGVIYCAVSRDLKSYWVTATALDQDVSQKVVIFQEDGQPKIIQDTLRPPPPPKPAAPAKTPPKKKK